MIRATIIVNNPSEIIGVISKIEQEKKLKILRIKNKLNEKLKNVHMNIMFVQSIVGEI